MAAAAEDYDLTSSATSPTDPSEILTVVSCVLSLSCGVVMLVLIFMRHITLGTCHFMFACLTIADMMTAGGNLFGVVNKLIGAGNIRDAELNISSFSSADTNKCIVTQPECKAQSFITTWSSMCCFLWTIVIEVYCFTSVWRRRHHIPLSKGAKWFISAFCWLFPLSITVAALMNNVLGQDNSATSGGWCWITSCGQLVSKYDRILWMLFTGKLWEILSYLTISNLILLQIYKLYSRRERRRFFFAENEAAIIIPEVQSLSPPDASTSHNYELQKFLFWIPMFLILARIWGTIRFFFNVSEIVNNGIPNSVVKVNNVLLYFHGIGDSSQATCNFILAMIFIPCPRFLRSQEPSRRNSNLTEQSMYSVRN